MKIAIDINGVLRDTFGKAEQVYQKFFIDDYVLEEDEEEFEFELNMPVTGLTLENHFKFKEKEDLFNFFYVDFPMQIFGHANAVNMSSFTELHKIYEELRDNHDLLIVSNEIQRSKPATLFFLSKYGCLVEKIKFYSNITLDSLWGEIDILITANPDLIKEHPKEKTIVKYNTEYNKHIETKYQVNSLHDFEGLYKKLNI